MTFLERLTGGAVLLCDGAMGTELLRLGLEPGTPSARWNVERPDAVLTTLRAYVSAGADLLTANTFAVTWAAMRGDRPDEELDPLVAAGMELGREAADGKLYVAGSIGPSGLSFESLVPETKTRLAATVARQARLMDRMKADAVLIETQLCAEEAAFAADAVRSAAPGLPVIVSFSFRRSGDGVLCAADGLDPLSAARRVLARNVRAVGFNCGDGPQDALDAARALAKSGLPVLIRPNAGLPPTADGPPVHPHGPDSFARFFPDVLKAGARAIGGCCGSTPDHIRALRETLDRAN